MHSALGCLPSLLAWLLVVFYKTASISPCSLCSSHQHLSSPCS